MGKLSLRSPAFSDGEPIPGPYGYTEDNINPPLIVEGVPDDAKSLALIVDDPDAMEPAGKIWDHWVIWNIDPSIDEIPEDWNASSAEEGTNDYGESGYGGPNPPDRQHTYHFKLYALESELDLAGSADAAELEKAMQGEVLDEAKLTGTYSP